MEIYTTQKFANLKGKMIGFSDKALDIHLGL